MSDPFKDLEGHLHRAARRRARRSAAARPVGFLAVAAIAIGVVATLPAGEAEQEAAAPPTRCGEGPPLEVLDRFGVFRRDARADENPGAGVVARTDQEFPGHGRPLKVWLSHARHVDAEGDRAYWLFPALLGESCQSGRPAVCWVFEAGEPTIAACEPLPEPPALAGFPLVQDEVVGIYSALVEDGVEPELRIGANRLTSGIVDNVWSIEFTAPGSEGRRAELSFHRLEDSPYPKDPAGCAPGAPVISNAEPPAEIVERFAPLRRAGTGTPDTTWRFDADLVRIWSKGHRVIAVDGEEYSALPVLLAPDARNCDVADARPGLCFGRVPEAGDTPMTCRPLEHAGRLGVESRHGTPDGVELAVLVSDDVIEVSIDNEGRCGTSSARALPVRENLARATLLTHERCSRVVGLLLGG